MISPMSNAKKAMDPITIPAIAPPDNPFEPETALVAEGDEGDDDDDADVEDGDVVDVGRLVENVINAVIVGKTTPAHLSSAPEL
jgi:hypothetical protein